MGFLKNNSKNKPSVSGLSSGGFNAVLDQGSMFEGKLSFEGVVRIDGEFKGDIFAPAHLVIGESGQVNANIEVDVVTISGTVEGDIKAKTRVELQSTAHVKGNITVASIVMEDGAVFDGKLNMTSAPKSNVKKKKSTQESLLAPEFKSSLVKEGQA